jgi:membrane-associated phospholipid phosphatase
MFRRPLVIVALWLAAFGVGLAADRPVARFVRDAGLEKRRDNPNWTKTTHRVVEAIKVPGEFTATAVAAVLLVALHPARWRAGALVAAAGGLSGLNSVLKWVAGRRRPVAGIEPFDLAPFVGGFAGLFGAEKNLCFPSGHAALAFANASALAVCLPRYRWLFYAVATLVAAERVAENAHYVSDAVAGAAVGLLATWTAVRLLKRFAPAGGDDCGLRISDRGLEDQPSPARMPAVPPFQSAIRNPKSAIPPSVPFQPERP